MGTCKQFWKQMLSFNASLILILTPLVFLPLPILYPSPAGRCAYAICIMALYWVTEAIPMAATALLPIVLMPWLGVLGSKDICINYLKDANMLFVGGLIVAVAVEKWNLHRRIALCVLLLVGSQPKWLMFGFMMSTAFLSMWISNTATTAMMIPIAQAILEEFEDHMTKVHDEGAADGPAQETTMLCNDKRNSGTELDVEAATNDKGKVDDKALALQETNHSKASADKDADKDEDKDACETRVVSPVLEEKAKHDFDNLAKGMSLCVAAAANIGGTGTLTGTGPNLVMKGLLDTLYGPSSGVNFSSWFMFAFPNMLVCLILAWLWMILRFLGFRELVTWCQKQTDQAAAVVIRREYNKLGPMSFAEKAVLIHFIILALLWFTREPGFVTGWSYFFEPGYVTDACVGITVGISLFMCPSVMPSFPCWNCRGTGKPAPVPPLLDWKTVQAHLPWNVILVLGGGFALAASCKASGLSTAIASFFLRFEGFPIWVLVLILCVVTAVFTEVTSNTATATIFLPILAELANSLRINPLYLIIPVTLCTSFAFLLPVATPPNAVVFAYGRLKVIDMVDSGIVPKFVCILILQLSIHTYGYKFYDLGTFPEWAGGDGPALLNDTALAGNMSHVDYMLGTTVASL